jgi:Flp pilus assembly pilin Flp
MRSKKRDTGQTTLEYAVIIAVVVAALVAMQIYMKRGVEGKLRDSTDKIGEQFEASNTGVSRNTTHVSNTVQTLNLGTTTVNTISDNRVESGKETVGAWQ